MRLYRRITRSPFEREDERWLIVHGAHHKAGTVWFHRVLSAVAEEYGLRLFSGEQQNLPPGTDVFFQDHSRIVREGLPPYRGSHLIRDPRDMVVSGYFYHLWTSETWVHVPRPDLGGLSYQEYLRSFDEVRGLHAEIDRTIRDINRSLLAWDFSDPRFLEIRYEEFLADPDLGFETLFSHYGFNPVAVERGVAIARQFSLDRMAAKKGSQGRSHVRSGRPGEWREVFTDDHRSHFKEASGDLLIRLGYESDNSW